MGVEMAEKKDTDWEAIEVAYRAGIKTLRQIGEDHGVSHTLVARKARQENWVRDISPKIKAQADAIVSKAAVSSRVTVETERATVTANAELQAGVRLGQREDIARLRKLVLSLIKDLEACTDELKERSVILKTLTESFKSLVAMEREAYGIDSRFQDEEVKLVTIDPQDTARRIAFLLAKAINQGT